MNTILKLFLKIFFLQMFIFETLLQVTTIIKFGMSFV